MKDTQALFILNRSSSLPCATSARTASSSWFADSPAPADVSLLSSVLSSLAFSASFSGLFFSFSGLKSFLTGRMLPGEGGRTWVEGTLEEPGGEVICLSVPAKEGKDFDACLCNHRVTINVRHALLHISYIPPVQFQNQTTSLFLYYQAELLEQPMSFQHCRLCEHWPSQEVRSQVHWSFFPFLKKQQYFFFLKTISSLLCCIQKTFIPPNKVALIFLCMLTFNQQNN